jgi:Ca-activated chloride channel family protein
VSFAPAALLGSLPRSWRSRLLALPDVCTALGLVLVAFALARPIERVRLPDRTQGIDILLCLDVSSSMVGRDLDAQRSRLELAREAARRFVAGRSGDRIGLVRFARYPDVLCPVTLDHRALNRLLADLEPVEADGPEDMTGIGTAVARAAQALRGSRARSRVVILLTDGEENVATADTPDEIGPLRAAHIARELGVRVYTIAAGTGRRNAAGETVSLDTAQVRALAETTGGAFFAARDAAAVDEVWSRIDTLEKTPFEEPRYAQVERFPPFLIVALALLAIARLLQGTVLRVLP